MSLPSEEPEPLFPVYIQTLVRILERIQREQAEAIRQAGRMVAGALSRGGVVHAFGTGHSHMVAEESFYRAGGLAAVNPILDARLIFLEGAMESTHAERRSGYAETILEREDIRPEDVAILISNSGRNAVPIEMALALRSRGLGIIVITNLAQSRESASRHPSGRRLFELADAVIDNCVPRGDAVLSAPSLPQNMGPASTVAGAAIINSVMIEAVSLLSARGEVPEVFPSANLDSTSEQILTRLLGRYSHRIRFYRDGPQTETAAPNSR